MGNFFSYQLSVISFHLSVPPNWKRPTIRFLAVILSVVLAGLLILDEPALATTVENELPSCNVKSIEPCILESGEKYPLKPNTGYKIKGTDVKPGNDCYGETIYAQFNFPNIFEETYPIQDNWELHFNTPLSDDKTGTLSVESDKCQLEVYPNQTVELLSGFKTQAEFEANQPSSGHFVIAKDYYAFIEGDKSECTTEEDHKDNLGCYKKLGSLTGITGQNFPALGGAVVGQIIIKPNAIRAPHWHLQFAEAGYCYGGIGQVGIIVPSKTIPNPENGQDGFYEEKIVEEMFIKENEVFLFPEGSQHYLRNIGDQEFKCTLFFTEGTPLNGNQLLTITLQNIVGNTPVGVLNPVFVAGEGKQYSTIENISDSPAQTFSSAEQGPAVIPVVEACSGENPNINNPGCPAKLEEPKAFKFGFSPYSEFEP